MTDHLVSEILRPRHPQATILPMKFILALLALALPTIGQKLIVIDVDDLGREFLAANPQPLFNALNSQGVRFDRFYSCPVCTPTRASAHFGGRSTHPAVQMPQVISAGNGWFSAPTAGPLIPIGQAVAAAGYATAKIGKWHIAPPFEPDHPNLSGWQHYAGVIHNVTDYFSFVNVENGVQTQTDGVYLTTLETDQAIAAVQAGFDCVWVSYHAIHKPFHVPPAHLWSGPAPATIPEMADRMLQALSAEIIRLGTVALANGYRLILFSDNGGQVELGGMKGNITEKGTHTALWMFGEGVPAVAVDYLCGVNDVYATVLHYFGVPQAANMGPQSRSMIAMLMGAPLRESAYTERFLWNGVDPNTLPTSWQRAAIGQRWKYRIVNGIEQLFDLDQDPNEAFNLIPNGMTTEQTIALDELRIEMAEWTQ